MDTNSLGTIYCHQPEHPINDAPFLYYHHQLMVDADLRISVYHFYFATFAIDKFSRRS